MKRVWLRATYVLIALGLAVCCLAAVRPDLFGIGKDEAPASGADAGENVTGTVEVEDALAQFVLEREQLRSMQITQLDEIIHSTESSQEIIDSAQTERIEILRRMEIEETVSGILKARGYLGAAVSASEDTVSVMIRKTEITDADVAVIMELVMSETDVDPADVKIIPVN